MKDESGRIIKFTLETYASKHVCKTVCKYVLTDDQERRIDRLWDEFREAVWEIVNEGEK